MSGQANEVYAIAMEEYSDKGCLKLNSQFSQCKYPGCKQVRSKIQNLTCPYEEEYKEESNFFIVDNGEILAFTEEHKEDLEQNECANATSKSDCIKDLLEKIQGGGIPGPSPELKPYLERLFQLGRLKKYFIAFRYRDITSSNLYSEIYTNGNQIPIFKNKVIESVLVDSNGIPNEFLTEKFNNTQAIKANVNGNVLELVTTKRNRRKGIKGARLFVDFDKNKQVRLASFYKNIKQTKLIFTEPKSIDNSQLDINLNSDLVGELTLKIL